MLSDYLKYDKKDTLKIEAYYVNKIAQVKGYLIFTKSYMKFEPTPCPENKTVKFLSFNG